MKIKIIVTLLFTLTLKFNVIAAETVENEKKTAESVFAITKQIEMFDEDVLKAKMKGLSMSETDKLVKMAIKDAKAILETGTIKLLKEKFGFITPESGGIDLMFIPAAVEGVRYEDLRTGQRVSFNVGRGPKGPRAENVRIVQ
jgi:CspA family cold shock protein